MKMTKQQAIEAMETATKVEAGQGEDHDIGIIHSVDGEMAIVGWQSGINTPCPIADLKIAQ
jgi:hypothetical protein